MWELGVAFYSFANIRLNFLESKVLFWKEKAESLWFRFADRIYDDTQRKKKLMTNEADAQ